MDEVESAGGPLICVESALSHLWRGIDGLSVKPDLLMAGASTDYERAYFGPNMFLKSLKLVRGAAIILGEMPLITGVWKDAENHVVIWRIYFADPDDNIPSMLASLPEESYGKSVESIEFSFSSPNVVIFDSALAGDEAQEELVSFEIDPGKYQLTTHIVRPTTRVQLLLHRFYPIT
jgi:hypothetical protein